jgi:hypothetical protein
MSTITAKPSTTSWLTPHDAAVMLGVHTQTLYTWIRSGYRVPGSGQRIKLNSDRLGRLHRITQAAIDQFQAACTAAGNGEPTAPMPEIETESERKARFKREQELARKLLNPRGGR